MTKNLKWRLQKLPTVTEISELVHEKIITTEEAKEMLLKEETEEDRDKASLESEIKFLRELVQKLSNNKQTIVKEIETVKVPYYKYEWYKPYEYWCSSTGSNVYLASNTGMKSSNMTLTAYNASDKDALFSDIKTF